MIFFQVQKNFKKKLDCLLSSRQKYLILCCHSGNSMISNRPARLVERYIGNGHDIVSLECISTN